MGPRFINSIKYERGGGKKKKKGVKYISVTSDDHFVLTGNKIYNGGTPRVYYTFT